MVCSASSSRSDLRKNGAASPNSFVSKRDMVAAPRRPRKLEAPVAPTSCGIPLIRRQSFELRSGVHVKAAAAAASTADETKTQLVRKERKSAVKRSEENCRILKSINRHVKTKVNNVILLLRIKSGLSQPARKMRKVQPTKQRQKVVHWPQGEHNEITAYWDVPSFILFSSRSRSVDICPSLAYATSSDSYWCGAPVSIDTKGKLRFCHCAKLKPAIFVSQLFYALYTLRGSVGGLH